MLYDEQKKVVEQINKYQEIINLFDEFFANVSAKKREIDKLCSPIYETIGKGRSRKEEELKEKEKQQNEIAKKE